MQQQELILLRQYGEDYVSQTEKAIKNGQKIQDAHEAIRPTDISEDTSSGEGIPVQGSVPSVSADLETFCGQQNGSRHVMRPRLSRSEQVSMLFTVAASKVAFDGFMSVYTEEDDEKEGTMY